MIMDNAQRPLIGEILLKRKIITSEQLDHALDVQRKEKNSFIGEILMKLGYVEERNIVVALVVQCGLPYIAVNKYTIDPQVVRLIPQEVALKERLIALDKIGDIVSVVMTNPLSDKKKHELEKTLGCRIATFISTRSEIEEAIAKNYN
jgi:type IV pilus assembly protein PilB